MIPLLSLSLSSFLAEQARYDHFFRPWSCEVVAFSFPFLVPSPGLHRPDRAWKGCIRLQGHPRTISIQRNPKEKVLVRIESALALWSEYFSVFKFKLSRIWQLSWNAYKLDCLYALNNEYLCLILPSNKQRDFKVWNLFYFQILPPFAITCRRF